MGLRTFNVRGASRRPAESIDSLNRSIGDPATMYGEIPGSTDKEYAAGYGPIEGGLDPRNRDLNIEGSISSVDDEYAADIAERTVTRSAAVEPAGGYKPDAVGSLDDGGYPEDPAKNSAAKNARIGAAGVEAIGGVINAYSRHQDFVTANNMRIMQANIQQQSVRSDAARAILREGTKATDRKGQALINAVAQGQSSGGDLAQTAMSNEDVYAAQNAMNIEINAMRSIYGLESEKLAMETNSRISRINRNASIAQNIISFGAKAAAAGA